MLRLLNLVWLTACAASIQIPNNSLEIETTAPNRVRVREPGWFSVEMPGKVTESTEIFDYHGTKVPMKMLTSRSQTEGVEILYVGLSKSFRDPPYEIARDACMDFPDQMVELNFDVIAPFARCTVELVFPPFSEHNPTRFDVHGTLRVQVTSKRMIIFYSFKAVNDPNTTTVDSLVFEGV